MSETKSNHDRLCISKALDNKNKKNSLRTAIGDPSGCNGDDTVDVLK